MAGGKPTTRGEGIEEAVRFQRDLYLYWRAVCRANGLALTSRGYVSRPALRSPRADLAAAAGTVSDSADVAEPEEPRLLFLRRLLERFGLLRTQGGRLLATDLRDMERFLARPFAERLRLAVRVWVAGGWWPDRIDPRAEPPRLLTPAPPRIAVARRRLTETISTLNPGERRPLPLSVTIAANGKRPTRRSTQVEARALAQAGEVDTIRAAVLGPMAWLGLVLPDEPAQHFSATRAAALLRAEQLRHELDEPRETPGRVVVQANFSIVTYPPLTAPTLLALDSCADLTALDTTARYALSREAAARAHASGRTTEEIAAQLEALTGSSLPPNVRTTLHDWERLAARINLTDEVVVVEVRDKSVLDALLADRAASGLVLRRLTDTVALVAPGQTTALRTWLLRSGELPAMR